MFVESVQYSCLNLQVCKFCSSVVKCLYTENLFSCAEPLSEAIPGVILNLARGETGVYRLKLVKVNLNVPMTRRENVRLS